MQLNKQRRKGRSGVIDIQPNSPTIEHDNEVEAPLLAHLSHSGETKLRTKETRKEGLWDKGASWRVTKGPKKTKKR